MALKTVPIILERGCKTVADAEGFVDGAAVAVDFEDVAVEEEISSMGKDPGITFKVEIT